MSKEKIQNFKIEEKTRDEFKTLCKEFHTTPSHELNIFVHAKILEFKLRKVQSDSVIIDQSV